MSEPNLSELILPRGVLEVLILREGGPPINELACRRALSQLQLRAALPEAARDALAQYEEATMDAALAREAAIASVAVRAGIAVGAALARFPDEEPDAIHWLAGRAAQVVGQSILPLDRSVAIVRAALDAVAASAGVDGGEDPDV